MSGDDVGYASTGEVDGVVGINRGGVAVFSFAGRLGGKAVVVPIG